MSDNLRERLHDLLLKYLNSSCSEQEEQELAQLIESNSDENLKHILSILWEEEFNKVHLQDELSESILKNILRENTSPESKTISISKKKRVYAIIAVAASVLLILGSVIYFQYSVRGKDSLGNRMAKTHITRDVAPGKNGAVLTLSTGKQIMLDSGQNVNNLLRNRTDINVTINDKQIIYKSTNANANVLSEQYNTLTTPKGRTYQVVLPDGTKVWLNAASSIKYPVAFRAGMRQVYLEGEAYFEVAKLQNESGTGRVPFRVNIVNTANPGLNARVEVLGTHFDINAYPGDKKIKTTLLEGRVNFYSSQSASATELLPGKQAVDNISDQNVDVKEVNVNDAVAWKNGFFNFNHADLADVLKELSRWYNVTVIYEGTVPDKVFGGKIQRSLYLSQVLNILQMEDIRFKIEDGNKLIVM